MQQEVFKAFFSPGGNEPDVVMQRVLRVCLESGYRKRGIFKCMDENRNLWLCINEVPGVLKRFPWFGVSCEAHDMFFENLLRAIRPTFPDVGQDKSFFCSRYPQRWPGRNYGGRLMRFTLEDPESATECLKRVLQVYESDTGNDGLLRRMDENRGMLQALYDAPDTFERIAWIGGWLEDNDIFFEDLFSVLGGLFRHDQRSDSYPRPWPGENYDSYLMRFELRPVPSVYQLQSCEVADE